MHAVKNFFVLFLLTIISISVFGETPKGIVKKPKSYVKAARALQKMNLYYDDNIKDDDLIDQYEVMTSSLSYYKKETFDDLVAIWRKVKLVDAFFADELISRSREIQELDKFKFKTMLQLVYLRKMFADEDRRATIIENYRKSTISKQPFFEKRATEFAEYEVYRTDFFTGLSNVNPIDETFRKVNSMPTLQYTVERFLMLVLRGRIRISTTIDKEGKDQALILSTLKSSLRVPIWEMGLAPLTGETVRLERIAFVTIIEKVKQFAADYNLDLAFSVGAFSRRFDFIEPEDYKSMVELFPDLKLFETNMYAIMFDKEAYDLSFVGTSYDSDIATQLVINPFHTGDIDAGVDYLTSAKKDTFITYLKQNAEDFGLSTNELKEVSEQIKNKLLKDPFDLLTLVPSISLKVERINSGLSISLAGSEPEPFQNHFPRINNFFDHQLEDWVITQDESNPKVFTFQKVETSFQINFSSTNAYHQFLKKITEELNEEKELIKFQRLASFSTDYFYMSKRQKASLEKILEFKF